MLTVPDGATPVVFQTVKFEEPHGRLKLPQISSLVKHFCSSGFGGFGGLGGLEVFEDRSMDNLQGA